MEPVEELPDDEHPQDADWFMVHGVRCKAESGDRIRFGWQLPSKQRLVVKRTLQKDRAQAVFYHKDFARVQQLIQTSQSAPGSSHQHVKSNAAADRKLVGSCCVAQTDSTRAPMDSDPPLPPAPAASSDGTLSRSNMC